MKEISYSEFKRNTHHKKVKYFWKSKDGTKQKEFISNKFYCNPYGKCENRMFSSPGFCFTATNYQFYEEDEKFYHKSDYGQTIFEVMKE